MPMVVPTVIGGRVTSILVVLAPHGELRGACDLLGPRLVEQMWRNGDVARKATMKKTGSCHIIDFLQHIVRWRNHLHMQGALALMIQVLGQIVDSYVTGKVVVTEKTKKQNNI